MTSVVEFDCDIRDTLPGEVRVEHGPVRVVVHYHGDGVASLGIRDTVSHVSFACAISAATWVREAIDIARTVAEAAGCDAMDVFEAVTTGIEALRAEAAA